MNEITLEEQLSNALALLERDFKNKESSIYKYVINPLGIKSCYVGGEFFNLIRSKIEYLLSNNYGSNTFDAHFCAYQYTKDMEQIYFKFTAPRSEINCKVGYDFGISDLGVLNNEPQPFINIGAANLLNYAIASYYSYFGSWYTNINNDPQYMDWCNFVISLD